MRQHVRSWLQYARAADPSELVRSLRGLGDGGNVSSGGRRFALHWIYGICGVGSPLQTTGVGWDGLLAMLACTLGHQAVVLAASSNDNGLLHQELVDYDLPRGLGWPTIRGRRGINSVSKCAAPFGWARADREQGLHAERARRRALLATGGRRGVSRG